MKHGMDRAKQVIDEMIESEDMTAGMVTRVHGDNLILARQEEADSGEMVRDDRVRLTRLNQSTWGLSVKLILPRAGGHPDWSYDAPEGWCP